MEAKRQDIGMDIDENKKDTQNKTNTQDKADTSNKEDKPDGSEKEEAQKSTSASREILSWVLTFALAIGAAFLIKNYLIINADVPTGSMENTIMPGDRLIGNRLAFLKDTPERGDVVIFHYPDDEEELYVKRVIGLPGEEVRIDDGKIYIDGSETPLEEDYAEGVFSGKKLLFNMTTNATLLNIETAKYLYEKKFNVTISLDGPKATHDSNRIFANSNKGTFDAVMQNLELIRKELPGFIKNIGFNAVIDLKQNVACSSEFFLNYETVKGINVASNYINPISKKDEEPINPELIAISYYEIFKTYLYACNKEIFSNYKPTLYSSEVASLKQIVKDRFVGLQTYQGKISPGGQCLPGIQRFFVTVDGKFFPCERVDEESSELCIGDLKNGFDLENAKKILNVAKITEKECRECWCYKMCSQCVAKAGENGKIEAANRLKWCKQSRENAEEYIKNYIVLKNFGCKFEEGEA